MNETDNSRGTSADTQSQDSSRREFLNKAGRFAVVTPATVTFLLATSTERSVATTPARKLFKHKKFFHNFFD